MSLNLDEILQCEERLQAEIAERECLLAALKVLKGYAQQGKSLASMELGALGKALLSPDRTRTLLLADATSEKPAAAPPPAPALPRPKAYMHPELEPLQSGSRYGKGTAVITWAIRRLTEDFTLNDIAALLKKEGWPMANEEISVVLTRLKNRSEIQEIRRGGGRTPTVFARPSIPDAQTNGSAAEMSGVESVSEAVAA